MMYRLLALLGRKFDMNFGSLTKKSWGTTGQKNNSCETKIVLIITALYRVLYILFLASRFKLLNPSGNFTYHQV
jgi:hypothetical protein